MSLQARAELVNSGKLIFQRDSEKADLLDPVRTQTQLIALLLYVCLYKGWHVEITAVRTDHSDDSALGPHGHAHGFCADGWPLRDGTPGNYVDASTHDFRQFLVDCSRAPFLRQIGLAGSAATALNLERAGPTAFVDGGADHVHLGSQET